ncbi:hypothetical protein SAMN06265182_0440 [Persephonella hydrogeniphila]|uniref:Uncharacterized protein n=1 Tax=Persephonella hydrogeniphila TaxID=198703 RepID=A0A285N2L3_9AQUI|nr:hypothetical protein [Persephonella hydrogeniphila]SNZ03670.1 hypothetical protein SAMN06265182_0440 [Persephonella hydrogeniphila]
MIDKTKVEQEIKKYISKYEIQNCSLSICEHDIDNLNQELEKLYENCCYFTEDEIYFLYILHFEDTNEVIWIDIESSHKNKFIEKLENLISKHKDRDKIQANLCIDLYFINENTIKILLDKVEGLKKEIIYLKSKKKDRRKKIESKLFEIPFIEYLWKWIKKFIKFIISPPVIVSYIFLLYLTYYYAYLAKIGITPDIIDNNILIIVIKNILIIFAITLFSITLISISFIIIYYVVTSSFFLEIIKSITKGIRKKSIYLWFQKNFNKNDSNFFIFRIFPKFIILTFFYLTLILFISEPLSFFLKDAGFPDILNLFEKIKIGTQYQMFSKLRLINSDLSFKKVNNQPAFIIGSKNDFLYYYELNDLIKLNIDILFPVLEKEGQAKNYCNTIEKFDEDFIKQNKYLKDLNNYIDKNKNKDKKIEVAKEYLQGILTREKLFYAIFLMPTFYEVYPLEYIQEKIQKRSILSKTKIENVDDNILSGYLHCLEAMCKIYTQKNLNESRNIQKGVNDEPRN